MGLSHSPFITTDGLVLCLDAANPRSYPGSGTSWLDLSGQNKNVDLGSSVYDSDLSAFNYNFNNSGPSLSYGGRSQLSVEILFRTPSNFTSNVQQLMMYPVGDTTKGGWGILTSRGYSHVISVALLIDNGYGFGSSQGTWYYGYRDTSIGNNEWCHFIFTYNGNNSGGTHNLNMVNAYINNQKNIGRYAIHPSAMSATIGGDGTSVGFSRFSNSGQKFSIIRIYDRQLTDDEVRSNYLATKSRFGL